ncbi:hypothetical protein [Sphingomonas sp. DT-204]|uniref:hypothetical protein n=1 Tax=Sphingomonas sp. DT-204 TaxID=3396166 RepID=UPI003F1B90D2
MTPNHKKLRRIYREENLRVRRRGGRKRALGTREAAAATATIGTNDRPKSTSEAVSDGVSSGIVAGMEQTSLIKKCMKAKGYRKAK